jgi:hypothetical protein
LSKTKSTYHRSKFAGWRAMTKDRNQNDQVIATFPFVLVDDRVLRERQRCLKDKKREQNNRNGV